MDIGERVKKLRQARGLSQARLAKNINDVAGEGTIDQVYISRLETGRQKNIRPAMAKLLADAFDVSVEYLLLGGEAESEQAGSQEVSDAAFLAKYFRLGPEKRAQVVSFTNFIDRDEKSGSEVKEEDE